jgi:hypothetical protein
MRLAGCPTHSALVDDAHPAGSSAPIAAKPLLSVRFGRLGRCTALGRSETVTSGSYRDGNLQGLCVAFIATVDDFAQFKNGAQFGAWAIFGVATLGEV